MSKLVRRKKEIGAALAVALQLTTLGLIGLILPLSNGPQQPANAPADSQMSAAPQTQPVSEPPTGAIRATRLYEPLATQVFNLAVSRAESAQQSAQEAAQQSAQQTAQQSSLLSETTTTQATLTTDRQDYPPFSYVYINGTGFEPGETVNMIVVELDPVQQSFEPWDVVADENGNIATSWYISSDELIGATMQVTATGQTSGLSASATFTDAGAFSYAPTTATPSAIAGGAAVSFSQSVTAPAGNGDFTATVQVAGTGASPIPSSWVSTSPTSLSFSTGASGGPTPSPSPHTDTKSWTVSFTVPSDAACGTYTADIKANASISGVGPGPGTHVTLTVTGCASPTPTPTATATASPTPTPTPTPTNQPPVAVCQNVTVSAGANCTAAVSASAFDNGSHDPDSGDTISFSVSPAGPYALGNTSVVLTVTDNHGASSTCNATVTVRDTTAPVPDAGSLPDVIAQCSANLPAAPTATDNCDGTITGTPSSPGPFGEGDYTITWTFTDSHNNSSTQIQAIHVHDTIAPVPNAGSLPDVIAQCLATLPPAPTATDNCDGAITGTPSNPGPFGQGDYIITWTFTDNHNNSSTQTQAVHMHDTIAPVPNAGSLPDVNEQCSATSPPAPMATDNCDGAITGTPDMSGPFGQGDFTITWTFADSHGNSSTQTQAVHVHDTILPTISCPANQSVNAAPLVCYAVVSGIGPTASDNCRSPTVTYTLSGATTGSGTGDASGTAVNVGTTTVTYTATDIGSNTASCSFTVTVLNPNPVVTMTGPPNGSLYAINTPVNFTGTFTDAGGGTHTGSWTFDNVSQAATIVEPSAGNGFVGSANTTRTFTAAGVYTVTLTVNDSCGGSMTQTEMNGMTFLVIVYDPAAGFVTGGGWINSPAGAYVADPSLTGRANFGFVSKYRRGANRPDGETEFQFQVANFNFHSTIYEWLVVSGPKAQYKGSGTINGSGDYAFLLTATDGQINGGGGIDKFRMKIWDKISLAVIYDNVIGAPDDIDTANPQNIAGGSIVIHR
jgi:HYR domain/PKD domain